MFKQILFGIDAQSKTLKWVNIVADAVLATLWPRGTHVIFDEWPYPTITKDGVTVAQQIFLEDHFENMGASLVKEAAEKTNRVAGDGTTSTVAILQSIVNEGSKYIAAGMNPVLIKRGMDHALNVVLEELKTVTHQIKTKDEKINIATISSNNDRELGEMIVEVIEAVWSDGVVTVTTNNSFKTEIEYVTGTKLDGWFESSVFINDAKRLTAEFNNPTILITSDRITTQQQLIPILTKLLKDGKNEIVLFAEQFEWPALAFLIQNYIQGKFRCVPVKLPSFGGYQKDIMRDFAALTNATVLGLEDGKKIELAEVEDTGTCDNIIIARDSTIVSGGHGDITSRIDEVKALLDQEQDTFRKEKLKSRLGKLTGKIANIKVGGASSTEQTEIKYRIEDALNSTKSAIEDGIVEGAGTALLRCASSLDKIVSVNREFDAWVSIVKMSLSAPFKKIITNGGGNAEAILWKVIEWNIGYNSLTQNYEYLFDTGIIDPKRVVENELTNAVATAGILLTSTVAIANIVTTKD